MPLVSSVANNPADTVISDAMLPITPAQINTGDEPVSQGGGIVDPRRRATVAAHKGDTPQPGAGQ